MGVVTSLHPLTFIVALIQHSRTTVRACDEHNDDYNDVTVRDMLAVKNHDNTVTTDCDETIDNTDDKCKKLNSLKHLVRTTVAGSHN